LPHGEGTYTWATGEVYEGSWKKGKRHGYGIYMYIVEGQDSILQGNWVNDAYKGMEEVDGVRVLMKRDISRYKSLRRGDGNKVLVKIVSAGMTDLSIEEFMFLNSSGNQVRIFDATGYENVEFPFWGKVTYSIWNRTKTARLTVLFEFEILNPGVWEISLYN
jgi:hypothetical protein